MDKSARYETGEYCSYEFDYQTDFTQILEEARKNVNKVPTSTTHLEETPKKQLDHGKKNRKSLRSSLFSWLKTDKKSKSIKQPTHNTTLVYSKTRHGHFSGPVEATINGVISRVQRATSGPLISFINSTRKPEVYEAPYMCLDQINNPQKLQSYGPVYLVT